MGRPKKAGLSYFPLDTGFFEDKRIRRLVSRFGSDGPLFYLYVLCKAYHNGYCVTADEDFLEDAALDLNCSNEKIGLMLHYLLDKSLLDSTLFNTVKVLSSHGIQTQYQAIKKALKRDVEVDGNSWILKESETEGFIKARHSGEKSEKNEYKSGINSDKSGINALKKRERESKEKGKKKEEDAYPDRDPVIAAVFTAYFEKIGDKMTDRIRDELLAFAQTMGPDCCIRAMDEAIEANAISWRYVRGILNAKRDQGVRSIGEWDRKEEERRGEHGTAGGGTAGDQRQAQSWGLDTLKL